ncbi:UNVERIFIED_CONTAM: Carbohydrate esterase 4 protein [Siphonaria sp. JEL0065]|nr:Carbohydrate esterase 4 protein [Siphonaria sp. JEL0065]
MKIASLLSIASIFATPALSVQCIKSVVVKAGDTCASLAQSVGAAEFQVQQWNQGIACPNPTVGSTVCVIALDDLGAPEARPTTPQRGQPVPGKTYSYCNKDWQVALTFDDGPTHWTGELLDWLGVQGLKATFFVNGFNFDCACIYDEPYIGFLKRAHAEGHQIASHTWSHPALASLSDDAVRWEMNKIAGALQKILGFVPRYMRPPYGSGLHDARIERIMKEMGYIIVGWSLYTYDADIDDENPLQFQTPHLLTDTEYLNVTVSRITKEIASDYNPGIAITRQAGYNLVTAAECLGELNPTNWYRNYTTPEKKNTAWVCKEKLGYENCQPWEWRCKKDAPYICN